MTDDVSFGNFLFKHILKYIYRYIDINLERQEEVGMF